MHDAYAWLRTLEHRIQLYRLRRTHVVPSDEQSLRRLGRSMGLSKDPAESLEQGVGASSPRGPPAAREALLPPAARRGRPDPRRGGQAVPAGRRVAAGGARVRRPEGGAAPPRGPHDRGDPDRPDPEDAAAGAAGVVRRRARPGRGALRVPPDQRGARPLAVVPQDAPRRGTGRRAPGPAAGDLPLRHGPAPAGAPGRPAAGGGPAAALGRDADHRDAGHRAAAGRPGGGGALDPRRPPARAVPHRRRRPAPPHRRRRRGRRAVAADRRDAGGHPRRRRSGRSTEQRGLDAPPTRMAVVAMGRYGGFELSYGSDADVMFVHEPIDGADPQVATTYAQAVANELRRLLLLPGTDPALEVDAGLRPEGKQGPLVRTLDSYAAYYAKWSKVWEFQALLRADAVVGDRRAAGAGSPSSSTRCATRPTASREADLVEVRRIKARVDTERLPAGCGSAHPPQARPGRPRRRRVDRAGLQMKYAGRHAALRTPRTLEALEGARAADVIGAADADELATAWRLVSRVRNAVTLVRGQARRQPAPRRAGEGGGGQPARLPGQAAPTRWSTTTCARPAGRTPSSSGSSGDDAPLTPQAPAAAPGAGAGRARPGLGRRPHAAPGWSSRPEPARPWSGWRPRRDCWPVRVADRASTRSWCWARTPRSRVSGSTRAAVWTWTREPTAR